MQIVNYHIFLWVTNLPVGRYVGKSGYMWSAMKIENQTDWIDSFLWWIDISYPWRIDSVPYWIDSSAPQWIDSDLFWIDSLVSHWIDSPFMNQFTLHESIQWGIKGKLCLSILTTLFLKLRYILICFSLNCHTDFERKAYFVTF